MIYLFLIYNILLVFGLNLFFLDYEFTSRVASFSNAIISVLGGSLYINKMIDINIFQYFIIYNAIYIGIDILLYISKKISNNNILEMIIHHSLFIIGGYCCYYLYLDPVFYAYGIMSEASTIFLNKRWFGKHNYIKDSKLYTLLFWLTFLIFRIINMIYISYYILNSIYYRYFALVFPFIILNSRWFYKLNVILFRSNPRLL